MEDLRDTSDPRLRCMATNTIILRVPVTKGSCIFAGK